MTNNFLPLPQHGKSPEKQTTIALSRELKSLLEKGTSTADFADQIVRRPDLHAEAIAAIPYLAERARPGGDEAVMDIVGRRFATFPPPSRSEGEWVSYWADLFDACSTIPFAILENAMKEWVRSDTTGFMPKPGQLRALAQPAASMAAGSLYRAKMAARTPVKRMISQEEKEAELKERAEFMASLKLLASNGRLTGNESSGTP